MAKKMSPLERARKMVRDWDESDLFDDYSNTFAVPKKQLAKLRSLLDQAAGPDDDYPPLCRKVMRDGVGAESLDGKTCGLVEDDIRHLDRSNPLSHLFVGERR